MNGNLLKTFIFFSFLLLAILPGSINSFAQNNASTENDDDVALEAREQKTDAAIEQIQNAGYDSNDNDLNGSNKYVNAIAQLDSAKADTEAAAEKDGNINLNKQKTPPPQPASSVQPTPSQQTTPEVKAPPVNELPGPSTNPAPVTKFNKTTQYQISSEFSYIEYQEPHFMREKGAYYGIYASIEKRPEDLKDSLFNVVHLDAHLNYGLVDYKSTSKVDGINDVMFEPRAWLGKDFLLGPSVQLTPYGGFGYRYLFDTLSKGTGGYDRRSQYLYMPFGLETEFQLPQDWQVRLNTEYDFFIRGWQTSYLSDVDPNYPNLHNAQTSGYGLRGSLDFVKNMGKYDFVISPYIRFWYIEQSDKDTAIANDIEISGVEPHNHSTETGLKLGVEF